MLMKFSTECKPLTTFTQLADVWLDAGRDGQVFTYGLLSPTQASPGDLVRVRLRGRPHHGLVVAVRAVDSISSEDLSRLRGVEETVQLQAVAYQWRTWIESVALRCHLSAFRMLKAALPAGWLGQARSLNSRTLSWVSSRHRQQDDAASVTPRQQQLLDHL